ncbi:respiratory nitrate reductase subunit gamma [Actinomyces slackii]|uniref:Nitrate reductase-like protein NarX n=1 Tax=Actinomyces slackii TaxID=52774 RepID=A0A448KFZ6_9ACTO|nr:respiratory nitrate reductase subunit gamma [Actinomyces slackii]VEG75808.1 Nitrate reductase-like protein narX [Actinomyces slackii]
MSPLEQNLLWVALPYVCLFLLGAGMIWRWRSDQFGWTSRSSQWYESRLLRASSPVFHLGFLMVAGGHVVGLLVPKSWTQAVGVSQHLYHLGATYLGTLAAVLTILGLVGLIYRRAVVKSVRLATTRNDLVMYCFLIVPVLLGTIATVSNQLFDAHGYDYRETISPWLRSVLTFQPQPELMADVPLSFKMHVVAGLLLLAIWPFTRLVHAVSAPVGYVSRPYVVYRSREGSAATARTRRGWQPVHTQGTGNQGSNDTAPSQGA